MLILTRLLPAAAAADVVAVLALTADDRTRSRHRFTTEEGIPVLLRLPRGTLLRGNTLLTSEAGDVVRVVAKPEPVIVVTATSEFALLRAAYHLGNRHVPLEISRDRLTFQPDPVLEAMLEQLGDLSLQRAVLAFEPEAGAYHTGGHSHADSHALDHSPTDPDHDHGPKPTDHASHDSVHHHSHRQGHGHD